MNVTFKKDKTILATEFIENQNFSVSNGIFKTKQFVEQPNQNITITNMTGNNNNTVKCVEFIEVLPGNLARAGYAIVDLDYVG